MIYLGSDHGGYQLKQKIKSWLTEWGYKWEDCGNTQYDALDDYPKYALKVAEKVADDETRGKKFPVSWRERSKGILICRSAAGMVMAAAKVRGARPVAAFQIVGAKKSRQHNDANILALSGDFLTEATAKEILKIWLETEFSGDERHVRRLKQIEDYERRR